MTGAEREAADLPELDEPGPRGPLLRDPPPPPGYTDPVAESALLEEIFGTEE